VKAVGLKQPQPGKIPVITVWVKSQKPVRTQRSVCSHDEVHEQPLGRVALRAPPAPGILSETFCRQSRYPFSQFEIDGNARLRQELIDETLGRGRVRQQLGVYRGTDNQTAFSVGLG